MNALSIILILFAVLETLNILTLYFQPHSDKGNGVGVFNAWEKSKADPEIHSFIRYLVNWVAGAKIIFITLILVIVFTGTEKTQIFAVIAMIPSVLTFFWRLFPIIRKMDADGQITPKGYSQTLGYMIGSIVSVLFIGLIAYMM